MKVHYLQHVFYEGLGHIGRWLEINGHEVSATKFFQQKAKFPDQLDFEVLIVLGGPMGVGQLIEFPWLKQEKDFILDSIENGKAVLGICLGAKLIASVLGGKVSPASHREIGWFPVRPNHNCNSNAWFNKLFNDAPMVFHWHGDRFEVPSGAECNLLSSPANDNQAFSYGKKVLALQFHLEATAESIELMLENGQSDLLAGPYVQTVGEILDGRVHVEGNHLLMEKILEYLFADSG